MSRRAVPALAIATLLATAACTSTPTPPPTVRVDRGIVKTSVSASGTLVAISEQNLGFPNGGKIAELAVKVGDTVKPGQVLARLDDFALAIAVEQKKAMLAQQQAMLAKITTGNAVEAAQSTLDQAEQILSATQDQVDATARADASASENARRQLAFDHDTLGRAEAQLRTDQAKCDTPPSSAPTSPAPAPSSGLLGLGSTTPTEAPVAADPACDQIATDQTAVQQAKSAVLQSQSTFDAARQKEDVDGAAGRVSVANAQQSLITARNNAGSAGSDTPADTDAQAAAVADAQAQLRSAQRDVENAVLTAPVGGVVSAINGAVGEYVGQASGTTAQAPGGAPLPAVSASTGTGTGSTASAGGAAFLTLNNVDSFQLVVPFEESDAARVAANQQVDVTVDAVPGLTRSGTVLAVSPVGEQSSGIVNYNATVVLSGGDEKLRDGQTAEAAVTVDAKDGVLRVPSSTVRNEGGRSVVSVPGSDGTPVTTPFTPGVAGDEYTEVASGLNLGQEILLPQAQVTASASRGGPPTN